MQESFLESMGSGYSAVIQRAPQIVSSLRVTVESVTHIEPSGVDPNDESSNSNSSDDEYSDLDSGICQAG